MAFIDTVGGFSRPSRNAPWLRPGQGRPPRRSPRKPGETIEEWARRMVQEIIDAQVGAIEESRKIYLDELDRGSQLELERGQGLAQMIQGMRLPENIQSLYKDAAGGIAGLAQGFSGETKEIASRDAAEQLNMLAGTGQEGAVRNQGENMGDVLYGVGGFIPAKSLGEQGAAFAADAAQQPGFALQEAAAAAQRLRAAGMGRLADFAMQIAEIKGQQPGLLQDFVEQRRALVREESERSYKRQQDLRDRAIDALERERDWYLKQAALALSQGRMDVYRKNMKLAHQRENRISQAASGLDPEGNPLPGYHRDRTGTILPNGWKIGKDGTPVKIKQPGSSPAGNVPDWGDIQKDMVTDLDDFVKEVPDPDPFSDGTVQQKWTYERAYQTLWSKYSGMVKNKGRLKRLIEKILKANGFKPKAPAADSRLDSYGGH